MNGPCGQLLPERRDILARCGQQGKDHAIGRRLRKHRLPVRLREERLPRHETECKVPRHLEIVIVFRRIEVHVFHEIVEHFDERPLRADLFGTIPAPLLHIDARRLLDGEHPAPRAFMEEIRLIRQRVERAHDMLRRGGTVIGEDDDIRRRQELRALRDHFEERDRLQELSGKCILCPRERLQRAAVDRADKARIGFLPEERLEIIKELVGPQEREIIPRRPGLPQKIRERIAAVACEEREERPLVLRDEVREARQKVHRQRMQGIAGTHGRRFVAGIGEDMESRRPRDER